MNLPIWCPLKETLGPEHWRRRTPIAISWNGKAYIERLDWSKAMRNMTCKGNLRQVFISLRPHPLLGFCLGWCSNFVGSESGQKQSAKLLQNMVSSTTQHPPPPPPPPEPNTVCIYCSLTLVRGRGGEGEPKRRLERQEFTNLGRKY